MAKSKYQTRVEPNMDLIAAWIRDGLSDEQIAENLKIDRKTLRKYRTDHPELNALFKETRERIDCVNIVNAYMKRALGYTIIEEKRKYAYEDGKEILVGREEKERHIPPDARALENLINLRLPDDPLWGKLREVMHDREADSSEDNGRIFIPVKREIDLLEDEVPEADTDG